MRLYISGEHTAALMIISEIDIGVKADRQMINVSRFTALSQMEVHLHVRALNELKQDWGQGVPAFLRQASARQLRLFLHLTSTFMARQVPVMVT